MHHITPEQRRHITPHVRNYLRATEQVSKPEGIGDVDLFIQFEEARERNLRIIARVMGITKRLTRKLTREQWEQTIQVVKTIESTENLWA